MCSGTAHQRDGSESLHSMVSGKKGDVAELGNGAVKMFLNTEQQIERNIVLRGAYIEFMRIYTVLSHMKEIKRMRIPAGPIICRIMQ